MTIYAIDNSPFFIYTPKGGREMDDEFFAMMDTIENTLKSDSGSDGKSSSSSYKDDYYDDEELDDEELENILNKMGLEMKRG